MAEARRSWIKWIVLVALSLGVCVDVCAQPGNSLHAIPIQSPQTGSLSGRLTDLHSAPLAGVQVVLRNQATGAEVHATTAKNGAFRFASLDAGEYTLEADAPQLGSGRIEGILITGGKEARVEAAMRFALPHLAPIPAAAERVDPVMPAVATTVTATQLQALPASGRRWQEFLLDTPAASAPEDSSRASFRSSQAPAEITIDGASTRLAFGVAAGARGRASDPAGDGADQQSATTNAWTGGRGLGVSEAAIHEVTTVAGNVEAKGLRSAGGRTSIHTESGANALHGQGFLFDRQNTWGAQNPFSQRVQFTGLSTAPESNYSSQAYTPPDHEIVWGFGAGSRIRRNKLFWFAALDGYHRNDPGLATVKHPDQFFAQPSNAQMQLLSAQLGLSSLNPVAEGLAAYSGMLNTLNGLLGPAPRAAVQWVGFGRIDWQAAERHHFTLEGIGADWNAPGGGLTRVEETYGNHSFGSNHAGQQWVLARWEAYLTPNLLAVTQGSAGRANLTARPDTPSAFESGFLGSNWNVYGQLPQIAVDSRYGFTIGNPSRFGQGSYPDERLYHGQEMVDWVHNRLLVKAGFEVDHNTDLTSLLRDQAGTYYYSRLESFISDALAFENFGPNSSTPNNPHNCDPSGKAWYTTTGTLMGLGALPCYSYYSQVIGPTHWHLSTNDWAGFVTAQWQPSKFAVLSAGLRWEREQLPPPIAALANPELTSPTQTNPTPPLSANLPRLGNNWGPRVSLAIGDARGRRPVLRLGYGMYYGRTENATIETALTQTGSLKGDLYFFIRPTDGYTSIDGTSAAPLFPYVLQGQPGSVIKPGAVGFAPNFRNSEVHQAVAAIEQPLPGRMVLTAGAMLSLGRRLPISIDTNFDPTVNPSTITYGVKDATGQGPIKTTTIKVPFYALWPYADCTGNPHADPVTGKCGWLNPNYQQITQIMSRANSTYEAAMVKITRYGQRGLSLRAYYTYAHAMDWNPNETTLVAGSDVLDPANFGQEYGASNLDVRHSAAAMVFYEAPWKLRGFAGHLGNGWMLSGIGQFHSGLPYTMRVTGSLPKEFDTNGNLTIIGLGPGMNGSGGDNRIYGVGRNTFRYPGTWKADLRLAKHFDLGEMRQLEILVESFNLFNHQNVTELETSGYAIENGGSSGTMPALCYLTISPITGNSVCGKTTTTATPTGAPPAPAFGQPLNINGADFYRERQIQLGLRMRF